MSKQHIVQWKDPTGDMHVDIIRGPQENAEAFARGVRQARGKVYAIRKMGQDVKIKKSLKKRTRFRDPKGAGLTKGAW
jgi:hypothetical protein